MKQMFLIASLLILFSTVAHSAENHWRGSECEKFLKANRTSLIQSIENQAFGVEYRIKKGAEAYRSSVLLHDLLEAAKAVESITTQEMRFRIDKTKNGLQLSLRRRGRTLTSIPLKPDPELYFKDAFAMFLGIDSQDLPDPEGYYAHMLRVSQTVVFPVMNDSIDKKLGIAFSFSPKHLPSGPTDLDPKIENEELESIKLVEFIPHFESLPGEGFFESETEKQASVGIRPLLALVRLQ